jgi:hypothetical protein
VVTGTSSYVDYYVIDDNKAIHLDIDAILTYEDLDIDEDNEIVTEFVD